MAKSLERIRARELRLDGYSMKSIAQTVGVTTSTVSLWCRDIPLTELQMRKLIERSRLGSLRGRLKGAKVQQERRLALIEKYKEEGITKFSGVSEKEFFIAGVALYWAEGYRKGRKISFVNSDPSMMRFMISWFCRFFEVSLSEFRFRVDINEIHLEREEIVKNYWIETLGIPLSQFQKTSFKKIANKKVYINFNEHYGTLRFEILKPVRILYPLIGFIEGLSKFGSVAQGLERSTHNG